MVDGREFEKEIEAVLDRVLGPLHGLDMLHVDHCGVDEVSGRMGRDQVVETSNAVLLLCIYIYSTT